MKFKFNSILFVMATALLLSAGCKKYFIDTGVHDPKYSGNILQYMQERNSRDKYFDSTLTVIKLADMENVIANEEITFFAPPSGCIYKSIKRLNTYLITYGRDTVKQLSQISPDVWRSTLSEYIFKGKNLLKDYPQRDTLAFNSFPGQGYTSYGGRIMNVGVIFNDAVVTRENGVEVSRIRYAGYRQLYLAYIPDLSNPQTRLLNIPISTSDIQPTNGVLHVLNLPRHNYGFNTDLFIERVLSAGISPATP